MNILNVRINTILSFSKSTASYYATASHPITSVHVWIVRFMKSQSNFRLFNNNFVFFQKHHTQPILSGAVTTQKLILQMVCSWFESYLSVRHICFSHQRKCEWQRCRIYQPYSSHSRPDRQIHTNLTDDNEFCYHITSAWETSPRFE